MHIECRRWFQKSYGNTYHTVKITKDDDSVILSEKQYGYGEQCLHTALDTLRENGHAIPANVNATIWLREHGHTCSIVDVDRQKDL